MERTDNVNNSEYIQSVDLAISILIEIAGSADITLSETARRLGETKPRILRSLRTMERRGLLQKSEKGGYRLGTAMLVLGSAASTQVDLVKRAEPVLDQLALKANETVQLRIRLNAETLCIAKAEPSRDLRVHAHIGKRRPLYAGSSKTILAFLPEESWESLLPESFTRFTANTIVKKERLFQELRKIRANGYCVSHGEVSDQLVAISVPVCGFDGTALACLNIVAPSFRTEKADIDRYRHLLGDAARKIERSI